MKKVTDNEITTNQFMFMLIGSMIAAGILSLPNDVVEHAKQDGWISVFMGILYPLYVVVMASFIQKKFPKQNILFVNKKCFGKIIGTCFNIFLLLFFLLYITSEITGISDIDRTVIINFLSPMKVYIVVTFLGAYSVYNGLKVLGRINESIFYLTIFMSLLFIVGIMKGKALNIFPMFGSGMVNIAKGSFVTAYQYAGAEIYLFIYPYVLGNGNKQHIAIKAVFITALIYTWITFVTIYCLGINLIPKTLASVGFVIKFIEIPVINNFRFIFMSLWSLIIINLISNYYYAIVASVNSLFPKIEMKKICIIIYPFIVFLCTKYINGAIRATFLNFIIPKITLAMLAYILFTVLFIYIRKEEYLE